MFLPIWNKFWHMRKLFCVEKVCFCCFITSSSSHIISRKWTKFFSLTIQSTSSSSTTRRSGGRAENRMGSTLSLVGVLWALISLIGALVSCFGFYLPFWISGKLLGENETSFGSFIRCGFPRMASDGSGDLEIVPDCGRYSSFWTIPSGWWRATTILTGVGATLSLLVGLTATCSCCISDILSSSTARFAGALQLFSGLLIAVGVALYPLGWGNKEVQDACADQSGPYQLGPCKISWSLYLLAGGVLLLFLCFGLSFKACRVKKGTFRI